MGTLTITSKGQITLRRELLTHLGAKPGEKLMVERLPDGRLEMKAARPSGNMSDVFDLLKNDRGRKLSIDEINKIAEQGWAGKR